MTVLIRKNRRSIAVFLMALFLFQILQPGISYALTSGPTQPEVQSFQPATASEMVDLFSGDFSYNIPLFELPGPNGGYPFNLSYQSGIAMDQEASWVGLGWNLNPGTLSRQMRGLPDEFKGDTIMTKMSINPSVTVGMAFGLEGEIFGGEKNKTSSGGTSQGGSLGSLSVGFSVRTNNYTGFGYSMDATLGFQAASGSGRTGAASLGLKIDSQEGVSVDPSITLGNKIGEIGLGVGYNSKTGLSNVSITTDVKGERRGVNKDGKEVSRSHKIGHTATLSLAHPGYTPQINMPMNGINLSAKFKGGLAGWGIFSAGYITGFYNEQHLRHDKKFTRTKAYGYLNYQDAGEDDVMDVNREKDGIVSPETPNLAIPSLSYDIYSVTGQGISAMYRPMRNDYGIIHDPYISSESISAGVGVDVGPPSHGGINISVSHSKNTSGGWSGSDSMVKGVARFQTNRENDTYEPWYFHLHGEQVAQKIKPIKDIGGNDPVALALLHTNGGATSSLKNGLGAVKTLPDYKSNKERKQRAQLVQPITNEQLRSATGEEMLPTYRLDFFEGNNNTLSAYDRTSWPDHHVAGYTATTPDGLRYNYALPVYNLEQEEVMFSANKASDDVSLVNVVSANGEDPKYNYPGTNEFLKKVVMPKYAHAHLLTSIVGPDYVDVTGNGVTADDLGYWVKFTYRRKASAANPYQWRDPFSKAHYQEGWVTDPSDDQGSYVYGKKELWYLAQAETKSHIATFTLDATPRRDGYGVSSKTQDSNTTGAALYSLKEISLYTRHSGGTVPIKTVRFTYADPANELCKGVYNNATNGGKLTLTQVTFEYGGSTRGSLNPYNFTYHNHNPNYDVLAYDRWGTYKPYPAGKKYFNHYFPYSEQDPARKQQIDDNAASWSLAEIQLPSGGKIVIDYESDDYAYVQHKKAMQMMQLVNPNVPPDQAEQSTNIMYEVDYDAAPKIRFKLEKPLAETDVTDPVEEVMEYLDENREELFFKIKINLRSKGEPFHEFISGYASIDFQANMGLEKNASGMYTYGYFYLKKDRGTHPFSRRVFQHLRTDQPYLTNSNKKLGKGERVSTVSESSSTSARVSQIKGLGSFFDQIRTIFEGFYKYCENNDWGKEIKSDESWIRLNSPDQIKYGGGLRVRQVTLQDNWQEDEEGIYGQLYKYTTEENGRTISSGVAAYEPIVGNEENPLRYAKKYNQSVPLRSDNNLYFEYPINETYFPGASVGYSKVTVMSLATASRKGDEIILHADNLFPEGKFGTTGMTVHEFYTAKDFPVITDETDREKVHQRSMEVIPFAGSNTTSKLNCSQGYSIVTNDMHGRPKMVSNYRQGDDGNMEPKPISWVKYNYLSHPRTYQNEKVFELRNVFKENADGTLTPNAPAQMTDDSNYVIGQETEFFVDMRENDDVTWGGGARLNVDLLWVFIGVIPVPVGWPTIGKNQTRLRTVVTNKVIFKSGILESMEAYDGGSTVVTRNLKWDKLTGGIVLSRVNNNFDKGVYSYNIPAYTQYQGMGAAYQNSGLKLTLTEVIQDTNPDTEYTFNSPSSDDLFPGDELLLYSADNGMFTAPLARAVYLGQREGRNRLYCDSLLNDLDYNAMIIRSGYRNHLSVSAGAVTALKDPTQKGETVTYSTTVKVPVTN